MHKPNEKVSISFSFVFVYVPLNTRVNVRYSCFSWFGQDKLSEYLLQCRYVVV